MRHGLANELLVFRLMRNDRLRRLSPIPVWRGEGPLREPTPAVQPLPRERVFVPPWASLSERPAEADNGHLLSARRAPFDNPESRLTADERHVVGHYRLGEALEGERADLFGCDASF